METSTLALPGACRQHVDLINQALAAGDDERAFYLAYQYFRARIQHLRKSKDKTRQQDADGFRRQAAYWLAALASDAHHSYPADEFRFSSPLIPGGDWRP